MDLKIDAEAVNQFVADAIIKSVLGVEIEKSINEAINKVMYGYDSPIQKLVKKQLEEVIKEKLETEWKEQIHLEISNKLSSDQVKTIATMAANKALQYLEDYR